MLYSYPDSCKIISGSKVHLLGVICVSNVFDSALSAISIAIRIFECTIASYIDATISRLKTYIFKQISF